MTVLTFLLFIWISFGILGLGLGLIFLDKPEWLDMKLKIILQSFFLIIMMGPIGLAIIIKDIIYETKIKNNE
jgi:hypothetical protein